MINMAFNVIKIIHSLQKNLPFRFYGQLSRKHLPQPEAYFFLKLSMSQLHHYGSLL